MKKLTLSTVFALSLLLICSCTNRGGIKKAFMNNASGAPYEVLIVMNPEAYNRPAGRTLFNILNADVPGLSVSEPLMKISNVAPAHFDGFVKMMRNVVIVNISSEITSAHLTFGNDEWANGQVVLYVNAPNEDVLQLFLEKEENQQKIVQFFYNSEITRMVKFYQANSRTSFDELIEKKFGFKFSVPDFIQQSKEGKDFLWLTDNTASPMNLVIYTVPYTDTLAFTKERLIHVRDSVMKANIPGSFENSYIKTTTVFSPRLNEITVNKKYCAELRGLWEMENDMMGGPFVSLTRVDELNNRLVTVEAFVYAPSKPNRNLIKRVEAALYTLQLAQEELLPEVSVGIDSNDNEK